MPSHPGVTTGWQGCHAALCCSPLSCAARYGEAGLKGMGGMGGAQSGEPFTNPFDIFEQFFGGGMGGMGGGMGGFSRWAGRTDPFLAANNLLKTIAPHDPSC